MTDALVSLIMSIADDELILGHRHSEWTGFAPHIEADVAFSSIAQDEIGHASQLYALAAEAKGGNINELALGRSKNEYRNAVICERDNGDWAYTLARHWLYDKADAIRLEALQDTSHTPLASLVNKIRREERYHLIHADMWLSRIAHGPVEGRTKLIGAISDAYAEMMGLFEPFEGEEEAVKQGWWPVPSERLRESFAETTAASLEAWGLPTHEQPDRQGGAEFVASSSGDLIASEKSSHPESNGATSSNEGLGGRRGRHTNDFDNLWAVMTSTYQGHPGARW